MILDLSYETVEELRREREPAFHTTADPDGAAGLVIIVANQAAWSLLLKAAAAHYIEPPVLYSVPVPERLTGLRGKSLWRRRDVPIDIGQGGRSK